MKRAEHTPEPWRLDGDTITGRDENGLESPIATLSHYWRARRIDQANGQHIVSCVNALTRYNPSAIGPFIEAIKKVIWDSDYLAGRQYVGGMKREQAEKNVLTSLAALRSAFAAFKQEESQ